MKLNHIKNMTLSSKSIREFYSQENQNYLKTVFNEDFLPYFEILHMKEIKDVLILQFNKKPFNFSNTFLTYCQIQLYPATIDPLQFYQLQMKEYSNSLICIELLSEIFVRDSQGISTPITFPQVTSTKRELMGPISQGSFLRVSKLQAVQALVKVLAKSHCFLNVSHCPITSKVMALGRCLTNAASQSLWVLEATVEFCAIRFTLTDGSYINNKFTTFAFEQIDGNLYFSQTIDNIPGAQETLNENFLLYFVSEVPEVFRYVLHLSQESCGLSLTLVPTLRSHTNLPKASYLKTAQTLQKISVTNILNCDISLIDQHLDSMQIKKCYQDEEDLFKRLVWNQPLSRQQIIYFFENLRKIIKNLFQQSKIKYLQVFNHLFYSNIKAKLIATSQQGQMIVKNQQMLEIQVPQIIQCHYVNNFVKENFFQLTQEKQGVIFVYMYLKQCQTPVDQPFVHTLLSDRNIVSLMETNYNTIELWKTILQFGFPNTVLQPTQCEFFEYIQDNLLELYDNIVYKEMLLFVFNQCHTRDVDALVHKLTEHVTVFFENIQGVKILKCIYEYHQTAPSFPQLQDCVRGQLDYIISTRYLNQLQFQFLERGFQYQQDKELLTAIDEAALKQMVDLLSTSVGFNSINALIGKQGWSVAQVKFQAVVDYLNQKYSKKSNMVMKSVQHFITSQENDKIY